ncbi:MAG TPA: hypothetical protein DDX29_12340 [Clostridiales bacterium]|nr:hypothetical protein [Clostridiales bacterium]
MQYISAKDAAEKWNISQRRVTILCSEGHIPEASMVDNMWLIPKASHKPTIKPFLKWVGGKGQLLHDIRKAYPVELGKEITKYVEPFVGGGAVLFDVLSNYDIDKVYISDINAELINSYKTIRDHVNELITALSDMQRKYIPLSTDKRKEYYYEMRKRFNYIKTNSDESLNIEKAALFIFLNKTCFNGLYRVNKKGLFNVPMGAYKNPMICDELNLRGISSVIKNVTIMCADYHESSKFIVVAGSLKKKKKEKRVSGRIEKKKRKR